MQVQTSRFGNIEISNEDVITFPEGLLGFVDLEKFVLLDDPNDEIFAWLQSCEEPSIAFPVLEPELFLENFQARINSSDLKVLKAGTEKELRPFCIITIPEDPTQMTANLKAPIMIHVANKLGRQCVLQDNKLEIREPIFTKLQQRVVQGSPQSIKSKAAEAGVAIRLAPSKKSPSPEV